MEPTNFPEANLNLGPPKGMTEDEVHTLRVGKYSCQGMPVIVSCFKVTQGELDEINRTGKVWLLCVGESMPPVMILGTTPFPLDPHPQVR